MKKWRAPRYDDMVSLPMGVYVLAERPDGHGTRAFSVVNIVWEEREISFLSDAATHWGAVPWALSEARELMKITPLGSWNQIVSEHSHTFGLIHQACKEREDERFEFGGLLLVRATLRFESLVRGTSAGLDVARHCVREELARDRVIFQAKMLAFLTEHPDWTPPQLDSQSS